VDDVDLDPDRGAIFFGVDVRGGVEVDAEGELAGRDEAEVVLTLGRIRGRGAAVAMANTER
jgi:hypothetical protein